MFASCSILPGIKASQPLFLKPLARTMRYIEMKQFTFRQASPAPQRQKELRGRDGEVIFTSVLRGLWLLARAADAFFVKLVLLLLLRSFTGLPGQGIDVRELAVERRVNRQNPFCQRRVRG